MKLLNISTKLRATTEEAISLLERRTMTKQIVIVIEEDCSQMVTQVSELEKVFSSLSHEKEIVS